MLTLNTRIMIMLHSETKAIGSGLIARRINEDVDKVQRAVPRLVKEGFVFRLTPPKAGWPQYYTTDQAWEKFQDKARIGGIMMACQSDDVISTKLKFLKMVQAGVHGENPILAQIITDYEELRKRQSVNESLQLIAQK